MAFIYCADIWCEDCGNEIRRRLTRDGKAPADLTDEWSYDSDDFPKYVDEDEEADIPQHCAADVACINGIRIDEDVVGLLFGELTSDGMTYVEDAIDSINRDDNTWDKSLVGFWYRHYTDRGYTFKVPPELEMLMTDKLLVLKRISKLPVTGYVRRGVRYFVFGPKDRIIKSVCTYRKARIFAEGVAIGRKLPVDCADGL